MSLNLNLFFVANSNCSNSCTSSFSQSVSVNCCKLSDINNDQFSLLSFLKHRYSQPCSTWNPSSMTWPVTWPDLWPDLRPDLTCTCSPRRCSTAAAAPLPHSSRPGPCCSTGQSGRSSLLLQLVLDPEQALGQAGSQERRGEDSNQLEVHHCRSLLLHCSQQILQASSVSSLERILNIKLTGMATWLSTLPYELYWASDSA